MEKSIPALSYRCKFWKDLFINLLRDLYRAERQLVHAFLHGWLRRPLLPTLKRAFEEHSVRIRAQVRRIEES
ncbi:MAG: DUF892 family protein [Gemmatimonadota bacterium]